MSEKWNLYKKTYVEYRDSWLRLRDSNNNLENNFKGPVKDEKHHAFRRYQLEL